MDNAPKTILDFCWSLSKESLTERTKKGKRRKYVDSNLICWSGVGEIDLTSLDWAGQDGMELVDWTELES